MRRWNMIAMLASVAAAIAGMVMEMPQVIRLAAMAVCAVSAWALICDSETYAVCVPETLALGACLLLGTGSSLWGFRCVMMCVICACAFFVCGALSRMPLSAAARKQSIPHIAPEIVSLILVGVASASLAWPLITYVTGIRGTQIAETVGRFADMLCTVSLPAVICLCALVQGPVIGAAALAVLLTAAAYRPELFTELAMLAFAAALMSLARGKGSRKWLLPASVPVTVAALIYTGMVHADNIMPSFAEPSWLTDVLYASYGWAGIAATGLAAGAAAYFCAMGLRGGTIIAVPCMAAAVFAAEFLMTGGFPSQNTVIMTAAAYGVCLITDVMRGGHAPSRKGDSGRFREEPGRRPRRRGK